jgi:hypothetical protein
MSGEGVTMLRPNSFTPAERKSGCDVNASVDNDVPARGS